MMPRWPIRGQVRRIVLSSGKVAQEALAHRNELGDATSPSSGWSSSIRGRCAR